MKVVFTTIVTGICLLILGGSLLVRSQDVFNPSGVADGAVTTAKLVDAAVANAKLANMANGTTKCRSTAGTGVPEDCTAAQVLALQATTVPKFRANKNAVDQTGIANAVDTKVTFTTEVFDTGGYYDNTNSKWTPPSGIVDVNCNLYVSAGVTTFAYAQVWKNGAVVVRGPVSYHVADAGATVRLIDAANGTDFYECYVLINSAGTGTVSGGVIESWFQGRM